MAKVNILRKSSINVLDGPERNGKTIVIVDPDVMEEIHFSMSAQLTDQVRREITAPTPDEQSGLVGPDGQPMAATGTSAEAAANVSDIRERQQQSRELGKQKPPRPKRKRK